MILYRHVLGTQSVRIRHVSSRCSDKHRVISCLGSGLGEGTKAERGREAEGPESWRRRHLRTSRGHLVGERGPRDPHLPAST